ncbi:TPA: hypothetical protein EYG96_02525 [Candidatus Gracilibacteria bacterium]|nr:hypothetical protein [Candidatus Gracilibacteria bacterium]
MKKTILGIIILIILSAGYFIYQNNNQVQSQIEVSAEYYQDLKNKCEGSEFKSCCLDSVRMMEVIGAYKFGDFMIDGCEDGYKIMRLRCPGAYVLCSPEDDFNNDEDFVPVPLTEQRINPGPGFDSDGNGPICTAEAKGCGDGTFVGRTGPNCEFAKCPGFKPKPDFVPTEASPIQLPDKVMTVKECENAGGEVFNTLGKTGYDGELIGKIEELLCPCACLVRSEDSDVLWVDKNGNLEEFTGDLNNIKTFDDCKKAGFKITDDIPATCTVGESHMTGGKFKTFTDNPMGVGKTCIDYTNSNCPGSCVAKCISSSCSEPDENGTVMCTSDCDGAGSCTGK